MKQSSTLKYGVKSRVRALVQDPAQFVRKQILFSRVLWGVLCLFAVDSESRAQLLPVSSTSSVTCDVTQVVSEPDPRFQEVFKEDVDYKVYPCRVGTKRAQMAGIGVGFKNRGGGIFRLDCLSEKFPYGGFSYSGQQIGYETSRRAVTKYFFSETSKSRCSTEDQLQANAHSVLVILPTP